MTGNAGDLVGGRYRLGRAIGQGGMGRVWQGTDETLGRPVAVKEVFLPVHLPPEEHRELAGRAVREARAAAVLNHPGIVTVHDVVEHDGAPWIVMELLAGASLAAVLKAEQRLPWQRVAALGADLADALAHAHAAGIVHRDMKPDNVFLAGRRTVVTDFGIARVLDASTKLTQSGMVIGTPQYMSPEQLEGTAVGTASDLWSLGATLYTAVEGGAPFDGPSIPSVWLAITQHPLPPAAHAGPLGPLLAALLEKDPARRPSAREAADRLEALSTAPVAPVPTPTVAATAVAAAGAYVIGPYGTVLHDAAPAADPPRDAAPHVSAPPPTPLLVSAPSPSGEPAKSGGGAREVVIAILVGLLLIGGASWGAIAALPR
ncbi:serine/threonine-protein kinase [Kitasatospora sp. LaBMicrA B282]|uniref:serine/threonine-protein kinase n=1 Tax=Kitasatospora sp. LaBMicrA B282 TaxID=3420949 RepID=UPI003D14CDAA